MLRRESARGTTQEIWERYSNAVNLGNRTNWSLDQRNKLAVTPFLVSQLFLPCGICWLETGTGLVVIVILICCRLRSLTQKKA